METVKNCIKIKEFEEWYKKELANLDLDDDEKVAEFEHKLDIAKNILNKEEIKNNIPMCSC